VHARFGLSDGCAKAFPSRGSADCAPPSRGSVTPIHPPGACDRSSATRRTLRPRHPAGTSKASTSVWNKPRSPISTVSWAASLGRVIIPRVRRSAGSGPSRTVARSSRTRSWAAGCACAGQFGRSGGEGWLGIVFHGELNHPGHGFAAQRVEDGMQQGGFAGAVLALQHHQGMREIDNHRHMEIQLSENRVRQNLQVH